MSNIDKYKTINEFMSDIDSGVDIEFSFGGKKYSITYSNEGMHVMEFYHEHTEKTFRKIDAMLDGYEIDGKKLREIILDIQLLLH